MTDAVTWNDYRAIVHGLYENPETVDYGALLDVTQKLNISQVKVELHPTWERGARLTQAWKAAKGLHPTLPELVWLGKEDTREAQEARFMALHEQINEVMPSADDDERRRLMQVH